MGASPGYGRPPWLFKGRALYQFHLVKASTAHALIPENFRLVEAFGYTLGGFFLANYDESPAGIFDELVVLAGLLWNKPTSCAWAARVLVSSDEACLHGREVMGLPSHIARFSERIHKFPGQTNQCKNRFLDMLGFGATSCGPGAYDVRVSELNGPSARELCTISLPTDSFKFKGWGPAIKMSLPSFSGYTKYNPSLYKYSCGIECRARVVKPAVVRNGSEEEDIEVGRSLSVSVMLSKPLFALEFDCMKMAVDAPMIVVPRNSERSRAGS